ncbi:hypothetical protein K457DRAFT_21802 [Linnemannia elongata AG-77]|uniref:Uncharacterized protein n=1 Tax=Linnemannia elongata AG-77 TaxID=1314771 RepID=A0A197JQR5_9FUNG|nr:hypothetical protein K457DRAFT_21802 [Linnemannia elongata AG-77]
MAFKGQLPKLVETAFGRIKLINSDSYTTIDEPVEVAEYSMDRPFKKHKDGITEIALTIDDSNIDDLFSESMSTLSGHCLLPPPSFSEASTALWTTIKSSSSNSLSGCPSILEKCHPILASQLQDLNNSHVACLTTILPSTRMTIPATSCFTKEHWLDHSYMNTLYEVDDCKDYRAAVATKNAVDARRTSVSSSATTIASATHQETASTLIPAAASQTIEHTSDWACDARLSSSGTLSTMTFPRPESLD